MFSQAHIHETRESSKGRTREIPPARTQFGTGWMCQWLVATKILSVERYRKRNRQGRVDSGRVFDCPVAGLAAVNCMRNDLTVWKTNTYGLLVLGTGYVIS